MSDTKNLKTALIIFLLIIVGLMITLFMMYQGHDERQAALKSATDRATAAEKSEREANLEMITLKQLIGHRDEVDLQTIQQNFESDMMKFAKTTNEASRNYRIVLVNLAAELAKKNEEHKTLQDSFLELQANYDNLNALYKTVTDKYAADRTSAISDLRKARQDYQESQARTREEFNVVQAESEKIKEESQEQVREATRLAEEAQVSSRQIQLRNNELTQTIDDLRRTNFERPDGKIVSVNQQASTVIVDLGSEDGLMTRMTFSVYDPSITGISFGLDDPEHDAVICEVCKREISLNASKASIEIIRILGPHKAEGRILDDLLTNPVVSGDVIYTPIWKPGQRQHFALASGMRIPGIGRRDGEIGFSDLPEIVRLIKANGGVVDSYISEGNEEGKKRGEIVGEINQNTTFLVMGDVDDEDNKDQAIMQAQSQMIKTADQFAVRKITLKELLSRMGWKNVTPVRGFGSYATETDLEIKPTGEHRASPGIVTPLYQTRNDKARITIKDRTSRPSTGAVSGLYSETPPQSQSPGTTSDLFRPRKPSQTRTEKSE